MTRILVCCGMPRSGTTYFVRRLFALGSLGLESPEETRFFSNPAIMRGAVAFATELYRYCLVDSPRGYSAWGSLENFVGNFCAFLPFVVSATSHRSFLEKGTIADDYVTSIEKLREFSLGSVFRGGLIFKQPNAEIHWRDVDAMFPRREKRFFVCVRNPYAVYASLLGLGWIQGMHEFLELARQSYGSSLELRKKGLAIIANLDAAAANHDATVGEAASFLGDPRSRTAPGQPVTEYWLNKSAVQSPGRANAMPQEQFNFYFSRDSCLELYQDLVSS